MTAPRLAGLRPGGILTILVIMKTVSITDLKARLSRYLRAVREGEEVLVTDRGTVVARISPVPAGEDPNARLRSLERTGRVRPRLKRGRVDFSSLRRPDDPEGRSLDIVLEERRSGW